MRKEMKYAQRPDPMRRASLTAEIGDLRARERGLVAERQEAEVHLKSCLDEAERIEREHPFELAQLAALNANAREFGGTLPDPELEQKRQALQEKLGGPGRTATSLAGAVEHFCKDLSATSYRRNQLEVDLSRLEADEKEFDAYELDQLRERAAANQVLSPQERERLAQAG